MISKFASERAANSCELRNRDTSARRRTLGPVDGVAARTFGFKCLAAAFAFAIAGPLTFAVPSFALTVTVGEPSPAPPGSRQVRRNAQSPSQQMRRPRPSNDGYYGGYPLREWYRMDVE